MLGAVGAAQAAGLKTGLLSNSWGTSLYPIERLQGLFDEMVISGEVGLRKPDPAIFELTTVRLGVAPPRCVFVDDHPGHLEAAAGIGMTTVLHRNPSQTISELEDLLGVALANGG
jgi:putative hydrolase of the HAD superfamily